MLLLYKNMELCEGDDDILYKYNYIRYQFILVSRWTSHFFPVLPNPFQKGSHGVNNLDKQCNKMFVV
jgi:hypothetical protein